AQIRETRKLIKEIGGERTVILSTHILPEAEMVCDRVLIIHRGRLVPEAEVSRMRAASTVIVEASGGAEKIERALRDAPGVKSVKLLGSSASSASSAHPRGGASGGGVHRFEVEGKGAPETREGISRKLVEAGAGLRELKTVGADLEEVFVRITAGDRAG
ncbi:unnamed protein product, partial [marine sediment metagenome]